MTRGYFGIGTYCPKTEHNIGTLLRSAQCFGADFTFVIGAKGLHRQCSNTTKSYRHIPHYEYPDMERFLACMPLERRLVAIEEGGRNITTYVHPERAVYLLGREDTGLPEIVLSQCDDHVSLPSVRCLNVAVAGSIVLFDRISKGESQ